MTSIANLYQTLHSKSIQRFFSVLSKVLFQKKIFIYTDKDHVNPDMPIDLFDVT